MKEDILRHQVALASAGLGLLFSIYRKESLIKTAIIITSLYGIGDIVGTAITLQKKKEKWS